MTDQDTPGGRVYNLSDYLPPTAARLSAAYGGTATAQAPVYDEDEEIEQDAVSAAAPPLAEEAGSELARPVSGEIVAHHGRRLPELPAWARRGEFKKTTDAMRLVAFAHVKYHAAMTPVYVLRAPIGHWRAVKAWGHWVGGDYGHLIRETKRDRRRATDKKQRRNAHQEVKAYKLERREHRLRAAGITLVALVGGSVGVVLIVTSGGVLGMLGLGAAALVAGSVGGRPLAADGTPVALPTARQQMLGQDSIVQALVDAKIITEAQRESVRLLEPVHKDGEGLTTIIELPAGMPGDVLIKAKVAFAAGLRIHRTRLVLEQMRGENFHEGAVRMWQGNHDPYARSYRSPLVKLKGALDTWGEGAPVGVSGLTRALVRRLRDRSIVVGGAPRAGKTEWLLELIACALLDPTMDVRTADGKGAADYHRVGALCATFFKRDAERLAMLFALVLEEMERTYDVLSKMGKSKVDDDVLKTGKVRRMLLVVDEWRFYATDKQFGPVIIERAATLGALAPAAGIVMVIGAQRPDANILPGEIADVMTDRVSFRVDDTAASNVVLGPGKAGAGWDASKLPGGDANRGTGIMDVDGEDTLQFKGYRLTEEDQDTVMAVARRVRTEAGVMPGQREDPIEAHLLAATGVSSAGGGANNGRTTGRPGGAGQAVAEQLVGIDPATIPTLMLVIEAFADGGNQEFLPTTELVAYLHENAPEDWPAERVGRDVGAVGQDLFDTLNAELAAADLLDDVDRKKLSPVRKRIEGNPNPARGLLRKQLDTYITLS